MGFVMGYPKVLSEQETLERAIAGKSLSRYGDGELRLATGSDAASQRRRSDALREELCSILRDPPPNCLVCIPNAMSKSPKQPQWSVYASPSYVRLYNQNYTYGSSFITRPDSAPWIDQAPYWKRCHEMWRGKRVCLVRGDNKSLTPAMMSEAASIREIMIPSRDAYADIAKIESEIGQTDEIVILCAGATATCLAARLSRKGIQALDLGHLGMFMKYQGAYHYSRNDLISDKYLLLNRQLHNMPKGFGGSGWKHGEIVIDYLREIGARSILDYGCGEGSLQARLRTLGFDGAVIEYDPAVRGKDKLPRPVDLVVCTDVLEHVEQGCIGNVLAHVRALSRMGCYLVIATRPANRLLPNGQNAHLIVEHPDWWASRINKLEWSEIRQHNIPKGDGFHECRFWLKVT